MIKSESRNTRNRVGESDSVMLNKRSQAREGTNCVFLFLCNSPTESCLVVTGVSVRGVLPAGRRLEEAAEVDRICPLCGSGVKRLHTCGNFNEFSTGDVCLLLHKY